MVNLNPEAFLEHIYGLMVIDVEGKLIYLNQQCADYIKVDKIKSIGKDVSEVFPRSKMKAFLVGDKTVNTDFYFHEGGMSVSLLSKIRENGKVIGVLEYDIIQNIPSLEHWFYKYNTLVKEETNYFREQFRELHMTKYSIDNIVGNSTAIAELKNQIEFAAASNSTVVITGETGTGKELVAHAIHNLSSRAFGNFIKINSAGFPESLAESELFGYEGGAFTGANKKGKKGKFELADKGTLFMDEIGQMPMNIQTKILRVLQEHEIDRIGSEESVKIDVRIVAATNEDLMKLVKEGRFREDLFYRLNVFSIEVPPLRERLEDLPSLIECRIVQLNQEMGKSIMKVNKRVYALLRKHSWPGNVRELYNVIEKAMNFAEGTELAPEDFNFWIHGGGVAIVDGDSTQRPLEIVKNDAEKRLIKQTLERFEGSKTKTAEYLRISRPLLYQKMERLHIDI